MLYVREVDVPKLAEKVVKHWLLALEPVDIHVGRIMLLGRGEIAIE